MRLARNVFGRLASAWGGGSPPSSPRRPRRAELSWDCLEERKVLSHVGLHHAHHAESALASAVSHLSSTTTTSGTTSGTTSSSSSSNSALAAAQQTLHNDVQTIEDASGTTVAQLTTIMTTFETLKTDGLTPSSASALSSFENGLVTSFASGTTLASTSTSGAALLTQFEALYTSSPTTQQTTDLSAAYNALAAAVTSSNITSADITTINNDYAAVVAAGGGSSTATYPYFNLVTGRAGGEGGGMCG